MLITLFFAIFLYFQILDHFFFDSLKIIIFIPHAYSVNIELYPLYL